MVFAVMPVFALGGIGAPALQSIATRQVDENRQGHFQGVLASTISLASVVAPLTFSSFYFSFSSQWPGAIWLTALVPYALAATMVLGLKLQTANGVQAGREEEQHTR